ncbi:Delta2-dienoyl-CoA-isomerase, partial [Mycena crocata]
HFTAHRKPVNAFSKEVWAEYGALLDRIAFEGHDVRSLVLASALPKLFSAGVDSKPEDAEGESVDGARNSLAVYRHIREFQHAIGAPQRCAFPVIAAVHGLVVGLGIDIISACDIRYAAEGAQFTMKEVDVGIAADIGTLAYLTKITANASLARELAYTSRIFSAEDALQLGLLSRVVPGGRDEVIKAALDLARTIARKSPIAVSGTKHLLNHSRDHNVAENSDYTAAWNAAAGRTDDIMESIRAAKACKTPKFAALHTTAKL